MRLIDADDLISWTAIHASPAIVIHVCRISEQKM